MTAQESNSSALSESMVRNRNTSQFVGFRLAGQEYAFRIEQIQEIVIPKQVTRTPQVPDYVEGVSNLRGTIIPIINLRQLFGLDAQASDDETRTIVVNVGERTIGCTVDSVTEVIRIPAGQIQPAPDMIAAEQTRYITGLVKRNDRILVLLDIETLLDPEKLDDVRGATLHTAANSDD